ncbi:MAG: EscN/YscN/HrcN family type III secretion system ATPase, partial [Thiovulaceae bacterium]|nr:EscN/YscN/HrcN family type III secretion system ATPase [Sulfurimonadaceae bacterium]
ASRVMNDIISSEHNQAALRFRRLYSLLKENEMLIRIGAYQRGNDVELDLAMDKKDAMEDFIKQTATEKVELSDTIELLLALVDVEKG